MPDAGRGFADLSHAVPCGIDGMSAGRKEDPNTVACRLALL